MDDPLIEDETETVFFGGQGEPLIHPDIFEMISYVKSKGKRVELITNGTSIKEAVCQKLVSLGIDVLWVSIDSFDPDGYKEIQVGSDFGTVVNNIKTYNGLRQGTLCELGLTFVLMKSNILQLLEFEKFTDFISAEHVNLSNMIPNTPEMEEETLAYQTMLHEFAHPHPYGGKKSDSAALVRFLDEDIKNNPGIEKLIDEHGGILWKGQPLIRRRFNCRFVDEGTCFIRWDGSVAPCMALLHSASSMLYGEVRTTMHYSFGNVAESDISSIWNSNEYIAFRKRTDEFSYSPCMSCGGCLKRLTNTEDCIGAPEPVCGACLWGQGVAQCP
jgi:Predicted Fe-S oxidoreductases